MGKKVPKGFLLQLTVILPKILGSRFEASSDGLLLFLRKSSDGIARVGGGRFRASGARERRSTRHG